ncbi:hypothetical protein FRB95_000678 [Tulasnella sp. JGI-2019a]|nr:hypothetical protein FRB95_000678 [Tulasnella sp. JGI-2019a]
MSQSHATQDLPSLHPSGVTMDDLRGWAKDMENWNVMEILREDVDENVEWTYTAPADGPLGNTTPTGGVHHSPTEVWDGAIGPIVGQFTENGRSLMSSFSLQN